MNVDRITKLEGQAEKDAAKKSAFEDMKSEKLINKGEEKPNQFGVTPSQAAELAERNKEILKRNAKNPTTFWSKLPGSKITDNKSFEEAALRDIKHDAEYGLTDPKSTSARAVEEDYKALGIKPEDAAKLILNSPKTPEEEAKSLKIQGLLK